MAKIHFTKEQIQIMEENALKISSADIGKLIGVSKPVVRRYLLKHGLAPTPEQSIAMRAAKLKGQTTFTAEDDAFITANYLTMPVKAMAKKINRSYCGIMGRLNKLSLVIPPETVEANKLKGQFKEGQVSFNAGLKQTDYMSAEAIEASKPFRFKKGNIPHNTKSDGEITIRADKRGIKYQFIRVSQGVWEPLHRYNWIKKNGEIPESSCIIFKNGNTLNAELDNLELISFQQNMERNTIHRYPEDIKELIRLTHKLNRKIKKVQENGTK